MSLVKHFLTFSGFTSISRFTGFIRDTLCSHFIGKSIWLDTFIIAYKFSNCFRRFFAEGALNVSLVPELVQNSHDLDKTRDIAQNVFSLLLYFLGVFVLFIEFLAPVIIPFFVSNYDDHILKHLVHLVRINFPYSLIISLCAVCTAILNTRQKFYAESALPIILNVGIISGIVISRHMTHETMTTFMSYAVIGAGLIQLLWVYSLCVKSGIKLTARRPDVSGQDTKKILKKTGKNFLTAAVTQINLFIDIYLAAWLPAGSVSFLFYADRLHQLPLSIVGIALGVVLLPNFSKVKDQTQKAAELFYDSIIGALQIIIPVSLGLYLLSDVLVYLLFCHGKFTVADTLYTAPALQGYVLGLPAVILSKIFLSYLFAHNVSKVPFRAAVVSVAVNIAGNFLLMPMYKHVGMAIATSIASWVNVAYLGIYVFREYDYLYLKFKEIRAVLFWSVCNILIVYLLKQILPLGVKYTHFQNIYSVLLTTLIVAVNYFVVGYHLGFIYVPQQLKFMQK